MRVLIALAALCVAVAAAAPMASLSTLSDSEKKAMFHDHVVRFNLTYKSGDEYAMRFAIFEDALVTIDQLNAADPSARYGLNRFATVHPAEFRTQYLMTKKLDVENMPEAPMPTELPQSSDVGAPDKVDWRTSVGQYMTPVRNQGQCGSCWAFSVAENIASVNAIAGNGLTETSVQQIVDCDQIDGVMGCGGGEPQSAYQYVMQAGGLESESDYPYTAVNGQCQAQPSKESVKISNWKYISQGGAQAVEQMKAGVQQQPLSICVDASSWQYYTGGVLTSNCGQQIDHCVILAGYDNTASPPYWIVRNSWGTDWGEQGYIYVSIGENLCSIQTLVTTAVA